MKILLFFTEAEVICIPWLLSVALAFCELQIKFLEAGFNSEANRSYTYFIAPYAVTRWQVLSCCFLKAHKGVEVWHWLASLPYQPISRDVTK